ncbi:hypothetical protein GCM10010317_073690 [Streptomyces mirabilis]|uniref:DUF262 domain-containing protein n=1 Tax=Streptomyces mirabilis TaxID=68239 RepID=UPI0019851A09|nr:DUF262 domain-containing protein [Streptomyces mirabilis]GHD68793.1 hypothetical protein GCM10010317_073690 [Streptomyces mirabilis]
MAEPLIPPSPDDLIEAIDQNISAARTSAFDFSFNELADMYGSGELSIEPDFQRVFRWTEGARSRFIESLLLELPIPPIFMIETADREYELIDGLQRISSFLHFRGEIPDQEPLVLSECDIVTELNGCCYTDLPRALQVKLKRSYVRAEILRKESDPRLRYYMFKRLNTGGERLSAQEVRNATIRLLSNEFNQFIIDLSREEDFEYCIQTISKGAKDRKFDQELVLRFFAFKNAVAGYRHDVADFLTGYMEAVSDPASHQRFDFDSERENFQKTFAAIRRLGDILDYGPKVLGTVSTAGVPRRQFSVFHFEGIALGLQRVIDSVNLDDDVSMTRLSEVVRTGKGDRRFLDATGGGKNDRISLATRIGYFAERFEEALQ